MACVEGVIRQLLGHCNECERCRAAFLAVEAPLCAFCMEGALLMEVARREQATLLDLWRASMGDA